MAEMYYDNGPGRRNEKRRRGWTMRLADGAATLSSIAVAVALVVTYFVPHTDPSRVWFFPVLGLVAPAIYVAAVMLALYWVIRWRPVRAVAMSLVVCAGLPYVSLFWRPELRRDYGEAVRERGTIRVWTYNVRCFYGEDQENSADTIARFIAAQEPDIVCLQEFNARLADLSGEFGELRQRYENARFDPVPSGDTLAEAPMLVLSKYRILRSGSVVGPGTSVWADLRVGEDTVRVFCNHLHSTSINSEDNDYITNRRFLSDTAREVKFRSMADRLRENSVLRAAQADSIVQAIAASPRRRIVCGDFNDTPMSYVYRTMARGLNDAFSECGSGYSHTFRGFFDVLRIDYVLSSDDFETRSYEVPKIDCSDHYPVVVLLKKSTSNN